MKKEIAVLLMAIQTAMLCGAYAQRPVGDTLSDVDPTYYYYIYNWPRDETRQWSVYNSQAWFRHALHTGETPGVEDCVGLGGATGYGNTIFGVQMYTDTPLKVVGMAAPAFMMEPHDTTFYYHHQQIGPTRPNAYDTTMAGRVSDSMLLYKPVNGALVKLIDAPWRIENPHRHILLPPLRHVGIYNYRQFVDSSATSYLAPLYEVMFEKPVIVEDSFVVAITTFNNEGHYYTVYDEYEHPYYMWMWHHNPTRVFFFAELTDTCFPECIGWYKYRILPWRRIQCQQTVGGKYTFYTPVIFPIIDPDYDTVIEHCLPVTDLRIAATTDTSAILMWNAPNSIRWEVKYGMTGMADCDYTVLTVTVPSATLTGLFVGPQYKAYVRGWCPCDSSWGDWVAMRPFTIHQHESVGQPGDLGRFTQLMPNPAHGLVSVLSSFSLTRIVLYDLSGRQVLEQEAHGISAMVDVSPLPKGTYIAAIYTPHGIATKKLVVE